MNSVQHCSNFCSQTRIYRLRTCSSASHRASFYLVLGSWLKRLKIFLSYSAVFSESLPYASFFWLLHLLQHLAYSTCNSTELEPTNCSWWPHLQLPHPRNCFLPDVRRLRTTTHRLLLSLPIFNRSVDVYIHESQLEPFSPSYMVHSLT